MQAVEWGNDEKGLEMEYEMCFTFDQDRECCGASGRKMRRVCIHCPNYERWRQRREKEEKNHGNESKDIHGDTGGNRRGDR